MIPNPVVDPKMEERVREQLVASWRAEGVTTILSVGRLVPEKDLQNLLRAFAVVLESVDAQLVILGEGPERTGLEALARELGVESRTVFAGYFRNPLAAMNKADVFVLSSYSEGFPVVIVEALYCGCRIVATRCSRAICRKSTT